MSSPDNITRLLRDWSEGDAAALPLLIERVYPELRRIAARHLRAERPGHTLQPTALVNEAYLRLAKQQPGKHWEDRRHFSRSPRTWCVPCWWTMPARGGP